MAEYPADWTLKLAFMRAHGVTAAEWTGAELSSCTVGAAPASEPEQRDHDPEAAAKRADAQRVRTTLAAGGTLVPRVHG